jgi:hypothetical protein
MFIRATWIRSSHESERLGDFVRFRPSGWSVWGYRPSGLHASRTLHLYLCAQTAKFRKLVKLAFWAIYAEYRCISVLSTGYEGLGC